MASRSRTRSRNASAAVFRRRELLDVLERNLDEIASFRVAGDWMTYARLLEHGSLAFQPRALNLHRRHAAGVTIGADQRPHFEEVGRVQAWLQSRHGLDAAVQRQAAKYREFLFDYLGIARSEV